VTGVTLTDYGSWRAPAVGSAPLTLDPEPMTTPPTELAPAAAPVRLTIWYAIFATALVGIGLYFVVGRGMPVLFDVLAVGAAA